MKLKTINKSYGFTLIELIVVIAIISVLSGILIPKFGNLTTEAHAASDAMSINILNKATRIYSTYHAIPVEEVFDGLSSDVAKMNLLIDHDLLPNHPVPQQDSMIFTWDYAIDEWIITDGDPIILAFTDNMIQIPLTYNAFCDETVYSSNWGGYDGSRYLTETWNGQLEYLLEKGEGDNSRATENEGSNTLGLINPFNGKEGIVNYNNYTSLWGGSLDQHFPPAILITNEYDYSDPTDLSYIQSNSDYFKGTFIFNKKNTDTNGNAIQNEDVQVYYVKEDGTVSNLIDIQSLLPDY